MVETHFAKVTKEAADRGRAQAEAEGLHINEIASDALMKRKPQRRRAPTAANVTNNYIDNSKHVTKIGGTWIWDWVWNSRIVLAIRAQLGAPDKIPWFAWVFIGAAGLLYYILALGGF
jgi:hypothetical protein